MTRNFHAARQRHPHGPASRQHGALGPQGRVAFHEGGHAVLAYPPPHADPLLKVSTSSQTRLALGVTQQRPTEERHIYPREYIEDALVVRVVRLAEMLIFGDLSTGRALSSSTSPRLAREDAPRAGDARAVRAHGLGITGMLLGEDLMHTRDYSEDTSRVVDEEGRPDPPGSRSLGYC